MFDRSSDDGMQGAMPSIYLEYGVDEEKCEDGDFKICERGMCFKSHWRFDLGAELAISLAYRDDGAHLRRIHAQGTVAGCEQVCAKCFQITLIFVDLGDELREAVRDVSGLLDRVPSDAGV